MVKRGPVPEPAQPPLHELQGGLVADADAAAEAVGASAAAAACAEAVAAYPPQDLDASLYFEPTAVGKSTRRLQSASSLCGSPSKQSPHRVKVHRQPRGPSAPPSVAQFRSIASNAGPDYLVTSDLSIASTADPGYDVSLQEGSFSRSLPPGESRGPPQYQPLGIRRVGGAPPRDPPRTPRVRKRVFSSPGGAASVLADAAPSDAALRARLLGNLRTMVDECRDQLKVARQQTKDGPPAGQLQQRGLPQQQQQQHRPDPQPQGNVGGCAIQRGQAAQPPLLHQVNAGEVLATVRKLESTLLLMERQLVVLRFGMESAARLAGCAPAEQDPPVLMPGSLGGARSLDELGERIDVFFTCLEVAAARNSAVEAAQASEGSVVAAQDVVAAPAPPSEQARRAPQPAQPVPPPTPPSRGGGGGAGRRLGGMRGRVAGQVVRCPDRAAPAQDALVQKGRPDAMVRKLAPLTNGSEATPAAGEGGNLVTMVSAAGGRPSPPWGFEEVPSLAELRAEVQRERDDFLNRRLCALAA